MYGWRNYAGKIVFAELTVNGSGVHHDIFLVLLKLLIFGQMMRTQRQCIFGPLEILTKLSGDLPRTMTGIH